MLAHLVGRRPRIYNALHRIRAIEAQTQMTVRERGALRRHATGRYNALEIGTYMGVSACEIAAALAPRGLLTCVDPWPAVNGKQDPCLSIARREFARRGIEHRIRLVRALSPAADHLLGQYDFIFVDGDHTEEGIAADWALVQRHLIIDGIACLHDTIGRDLGSTRYYETTISRDSGFGLIDEVDSMAVLRRLG